MKGSARAWLKSLPAGSIYNWDDLVDSFVRNFQATYKQPASIEELRACTQRSGESIRSYIQWWTILENTGEDISEERAIDAFNAGLRMRELKEELGNTKPKTIALLMDIANRWAYGEHSLHNNRARLVDDDDVDARYPTDSGRRRDRNSDRRRKCKDHGYEGADDIELVASGFPNMCDDVYRNSSYHEGRGSRSQNREWRPRRARDDAPSPHQLLSGPCTIHFYTDDDDTKKSRHLLKDCRQF